MRIKVDERIAELIVLGGSFLGGGGGGSFKAGLSIARLILGLGDLYIVSIDELKADSRVAIASRVGAPAAKDKYVTIAHMIKSAELLIRAGNFEVAGFISCENGGTASTNGWAPAVMLELPVVDAPADGRAHPTGVMGSMGLHKIKDYISIQAVVGGNKEKGMYIEMVVRGALERVDKLVREAAVQAGGLVAVTRDPVTPEFLKYNSAVGGLSKALEIGEILRRYEGDVEEGYKKVIEFLGGGQIVDRVIVREVYLETRGGFDVGRVILVGTRETYEVTFWNEYMTLEDSKGRIYASFPDLIVTVDAKSGVPLTSAEIKSGMEVILITVPREYIPLGAGVRDPDVLKHVEIATGKKIVRDV